MVELFRPLLKRAALRPFFLDEDGLHLLDQRALPGAEQWSVLTSVEEVAQAIEALAVRGAPAIGGAAALAVAMVARAHATSSDEAITRAVREAAARLARTRPTAVNLFHALAAVTAPLADVEGGAPAKARLIVDAAERVVDEDEAACATMGDHGAALLSSGDVVMTICHTGALATCGQGTALGVLKSARAQQKDVRVVALETRPLLQGARLTAWECQREGLPLTLITDGMAAFAMKRLGVTKCIVGADRIAADGSTANKIGTYALAVAARHHGVPLYVAAPSTTIDVHTASGDDIPIEERAADEVRTARGVPLAPAAAPVWNPAFDVTPPELVTAFITERGVLRPPFRLSDG
jgi:methylthioribose-1-phosphate isomerase